MNRTTVYLIAAILMIGSPPGDAADGPRTRDALSINKMLGRGMNLGNIFESPSVGGWGLTAQPNYVPNIRAAGFESVRLPVRWDTHAGPAPDFTIDPGYFAQIDAVIDQAVSNDLAVVLDIHHDPAAASEPDGQIPRAALLWKQIATHYKDRSDRLVFELLNEPNGAMTDEKWQASFPTLLAAIRESNPTRAVIIGPGHWNSLASLDALQLPETDRNLIATVHYYTPFEFTHQDAEWVPESKAWKGRTWTGSTEETATVRRDLGKAAAWGKAHNRPIYLGEFGSYGKADMASRVAWTGTIAREAEILGISWCYWEFAAGFGAYDPATDKWRQSLLDALITPSVKMDDPRTLKPLKR